ncbi:major capsid protein L1 [Oryctolagus cuniculus papillomavirus 1]|uniref:Major capsid protein L1 n=1 Tax=Oryctolagus cuniculus papillomavirus 1 TaxID=2772507 RepID=Q9J024_9PAPI|nr:major capsid protein L1 [Oryctolagus cuniculus papillomavirus 1]AAF67129.1 major capsid protein L1 [Oryctolagus cuniculus papillomavirus 1]
MAVWLSQQSKFYVPPQPITKILSTDEYVSRTNIFYHASTDRLLTVGHPYYELEKGGTVVVPKVSPNQYRVFRVRLPDPNKFAFNDKQLYDPEKERLVWAVRGVEVGRGQPLGVNVTGNPLFNRYDDVENSSRYNSGHNNDQDNRQNIAFDPKQTQLFILGCVPATGEHWTQAQRCAGAGYEQGDCPPIELINTVIEDGDMSDIGLGAMDHRLLQVSKAEVPMELVNSVSKYPDYIKMLKDPFGDSLFFYARGEQMYARHFFSRAGDDKENPTDTLITGKGNQSTVSTDNYMVTPSGSLVSSDSQVFNRAYWLQRAQGMNNGICWNNQMFVTIVDNTRGTVMNIVTKANGNGAVDTWANNAFKSYLRHVEEFELQFIVQLCKVRLSPENLAFLHKMQPSIIDNWQLSITAPATSNLEDQYRFIQSLATKCPPVEPPQEDTDPYKNYKFWDVDLSEKMSDQLDQFPLGRKFLNQSGLGQNRQVKTAAPTTSMRGLKRKRRI